MEGSNIYVRLAEKTIEELLKRETVDTKKILPQPLPRELNKKAGAFVSIKKNGQLRGCIGTIEGVRDNLGEEIISNAISAASRDPRFPAIREEELPQLDISVDVLGVPERVGYLEKLDPHKYGVIVEKGFQRGVLLPDLEGVDTVHEQLEIVMRKAGLSPFEDLDSIIIYRFTVNRYK